MSLLCFENKNIVRRCFQLKNLRCEMQKWTGAAKVDCKESKFYWDKRLFSLSLNVKLG